VIRPPVRNEIWRGDRFEKSFDGDTTLAAMFVEIWAITTTTIATISRIGRSSSSRATSVTGSQIGSPNSMIVAQVTAIPMNENAVIVSGIAMLWPTICERWSRA
jgi:hypothetical protein